MLGNWAYQIPTSELTFGDALLDPAEHVALFSNWDANGHMVMIEECGSTPDCCGSEATCCAGCPCGSEANCDDYCPGCPIQADTWSGLDGFIPIRRNGW